MKIKLPFTEKFLWDFYNFVDKAGKLTEPLMSKRWYGFKGLEEIIWPDIYLFKDAWEDRYREERDRKRFTRFVWTLKNKGYLRSLRVKDESAVMLTPKGMEKLFRVRLKMIDKTRRKDKKWQMVLFDIPEQKKRERDWFRKALQYLGYKKLQKSIWVCPYDTLKETKNLIKRYKLEAFVDLLLVNKIKPG